jgi:hypothetical protein
MTWELKRTDANCHALSLINKKKTSTRRILLLADIHWDNSHCDLGKLKEDLDKALKEKIPVFIFGDFFCAMQGKWDPRSSQDALREEHRGGNYLDLLVESAAKWLNPYKEIITLITPGNHETSILKRHETNLIERLITLLRHNGSSVEMGTYWGFIRATMFWETKAIGAATIHYSHGYGGGGEITRGLIDWSRTRSQYIADVYVAGHIHRRNCDENVIAHMTVAGRMKQSRQLFLRCGTYKDEHQPNGWHVEKGRAGRPIGGWWLDISTSYANQENNPSIDVTAVMT